MRIAILHLSDIHFKSEGNIVLPRTEAICKAVQNLFLEMGKLFVVVSGDIAYSGIMDEYYEAISLFDQIKEHILTYLGQKTSFLMIPGNHDCNHNIKNINIRTNLINDILDKRLTKIDEAVIEQCCEVQKDWFSFYNAYQDTESIYMNNKLLSLAKYHIDGYDVIFNCYNSSWISQRDEQQGSMHFPYELYSEDKCFRQSSNISISILHHPFNWQNYNQLRGLKKHIERTSDIILTGHEHISSKSRIDDLEGQSTIYIEGTVLQDHDNNDNSGFNVILIDLEEERLQIYNYKWNEEKYTPDKVPDWINYKTHKLSNRTNFVVSTEFEKFLNDIGATFFHPNKSNIILEDLFIFPNLRNLKKEEKSTSKIISREIVNSNVLLKINITENKVLLVGAEKSGKTTMCKVLFKHYYDNDHVPLYIDGGNIKSPSLEDFNKLIERCFAEQYQPNTLEEFKQLENRKKVLIIDNFDKSGVSIKYKSAILSTIDKYYSNIIVTADDLFEIEKIMYDKEKEKTVLQSYQHYAILEFGHMLRAELINKWNVLGVTYLEDDQLIRKNDNSKHIIDSIIGKNYVPLSTSFCFVPFSGK